MAASTRKPGSKTAIETLQEIVADFRCANEKAKSIELGLEERDQVGMAGSQASADISCCFCRQKVQDGAIVVSLACCGAPAHIGCFVSAANLQRQYKFPVCSGPMNESQYNMCRGLGKIPLVATDYHF